LNAALVRGGNRLVCVTQNPRFINHARIKHFRRVSTRYDKLAESYLVFASLACAFGSVVNVNTA
ncbi:MAG: IS5/IS1182 family transposase, partial [Burkholderia gladioli]